MVLHAVDQKVGVFTIKVDSAPVKIAAVSERRRFSVVVVKKGFQVLAFTLVLISIF